MAKPSTIEKFHKRIFDDVSDLILTEAEERQLTRIRAVYTVQLAKPSVPNTEIVQMLQNEHKVSLSQAYRDIAQTHLLLGSVPNAGKEWIRYMVVETLKSVIEDCDAVIERYHIPSGMEVDIQIAFDAEAVIRASEVKTKASDKLAKYARLDQTDPEPLPYDKIVPVNVEYFNDPSILTGKKVDNPTAEVERILKKYIDFEDVRE